MNATEQARQAYAPAHSPIRSNRSIEYQAFSDIVGRMQEAAAAGRPGFRDLVHALADNRRLWTILATDVADSGNSLPQDLRAQIFYLAEFTDLHTSKVLRGDVGPEALIEINTAVMRGLSQAPVPANEGSLN